MLVRILCKLICEIDWTNFAKKLRNFETEQEKERIL